MLGGQLPSYFSSDHLYASSKKESREASVASLGGGARFLRDPDGRLNCGLDIDTCHF